MHTVTVRQCALDWTLMVGEKCRALLVIDTHAKCGMSVQPHCWSLVHMLSVG